MADLFELPPLPWGGDIDAMLDACSTREITEYIKEYALAAVKAEREACAKEIERTYGINAAVIRARGKP